MSDRSPRKPLLPDPREQPTPPKDKNRRAERYYKDQTKRYRKDLEESIGYNEWDEDQG